MSNPSNTMGIGTIGNYYGNLCVANDDEGKFFWSIEDHDGCRWEEIPESLYRELVKFEESQRPTTPPVSVDLLEVLRDVLKMPYPAVGQVMSQQSASDIQRHREMVRNAIAKATGEQR